MRRRNINFCTTCRKETEYTLQKIDIHKTIRDKEYVFNITSAVCNECGEEMSIPGLADKNVQEIDEQYRAYENIVSIDDIERLMKIYDIGKGPLSLALGFGEVTIPRYLAGQVPSKEYSDIIRKALSSPEYMKEKLYENREKVAPVAFTKSLIAIEQLENLFAISNSMLRVISYLFEILEEVTPLMLQKLLYFIQGVSYAVNGEPMFPEICQAWAHGPVYPEVYDLFRDFKYNPIDDARFVIFDGAGDKLTKDERKVVDLVAKTFGMYSGRILEIITHEEEPWKKARKGYADGIPAREPILAEDIKSYYLELNKKYDFSSEDGLKEYIGGILKFS